MRSVTEDTKSWHCIEINFKTASEDICHFIISHSILQGTSRAKFCCYSKLNVYFFAGSRMFNNPKHPFSQFLSADTQADDGVLQSLFLRASCSCHWIGCFGHTEIGGIFPRELLIQAVYHLLAAIQKKHFPSLQPGSCLRKHICNYFLSSFPIQSQNLL